MHAHHILSAQSDERVRQVESLEIPIGRALESLRPRNSGLLGTAINLTQAHQPAARFAISQEKMQANFVWVCAKDDSDHRSKNITNDRLRINLVARSAGHLVRLTSKIIIKDMYATAHLLLYLSE